MTKPTTSRHCARISTKVPNGVVKNSAMGSVSSHHRYSVFRAIGGRHFGVYRPEPARQRRRDRVNRIAAPVSTLFGHERAHMAREPVAADERVLRGGAFGIALDVAVVARAAHCNPEIHQIAIEKPRLDALILGRGGTRRVAPGTARERQRGYEGRRHPHSAATGRARRALALALSSAISSLARAIGLVR